jgi:hypothetical protein
MTLVPANNLHRLLHHPEHGISTIGSISTIQNNLSPSKAFFLRCASRKHEWEISRSAKTTLHSEHGYVDMWLSKRII